MLGPRHRGVQVPVQQHRLRNVAGRMCFKMSPNQGWRLEGFEETGGVGGAGGVEGFSGLGVLCLWPCTMKWVNEALNISRTITQESSSTEAGKEASVGGGTCLERGRGKWPVSNCPSIDLRLTVGLAQQCAGGAQKTDTFIWACTEQHT